MVMIFLTSDSRATAGSGKVNLLRIINQLTWNTDRSLIDFGTIYPTDTPQKKQKTVGCNRALHEAWKFIPRFNG